MPGPWKGQGSRGEQKGMWALAWWRLQLRGGIASKQSPAQLNLRQEPQKRRQGAGGKESEGCPRQESGRFLCARTVEPRLPSSLLLPSPHQVQVLFLLSTILFWLLEVKESGKGFQSVHRYGLKTLRKVFYGAKCPNRRGHCHSVATCLLGPDVDPAVFCPLGLHPRYF